MSYVRFQFRSTVFAERVRDQLARSDVGCIPPTGSGLVVDAIEYPPAGPMPMSGAQGLVLEQVETLAAQTRALVRPRIFDDILDTGYDDVVIPVVGGQPITLSKQRLLLTLPITMTVRSLADLINASGQPLVFTVDVRLAVDLVHRDGKEFLKVGYDGLGHHEGTDPGLEALVAAELGSGTIRPREVEFDYADQVLDWLNGLGAANQPPKVCWSGMTLSPDRNTVEFRLELTFEEDAGGTYDPDGWRRFHSRNIDDLTGGRDWAVGLGEDLMRRTVHDGAQEELSGKDDFDLDSDPNVEWQPDVPGFRTTFSGEAVDACFCLFVQLDLNVDVTVGTQLSLVEAGPTPTLQLDTFVHADPTSAAEQGCCWLTAGAFWPIVGPIYASRDQIGWGLFLVGLIYWPIGGGLFVSPLLGGRPQQLEDNCFKDPDNDEHQVCTIKVDLNPPAAKPCDPAATTVNLDAVTGRSDAMVLSGAVAQRRLAAPQAAVTEPTGFEWIGPRPTCEGTEGDWSAVSTFTVSQAGGEFPLEVCDVIPVGPLKGLYQARITARTECPTTAAVEVSTLAFTPGNPNPDWVLVLTNVGAVLVRIPVVPPLSQEQRDAHEAFMRKWRIRHCLRPDNWWGEGELLATAWSLDAPPRGVPTRRLWIVRAGGLECGELLVAHGGSKAEHVLGTGAVAHERKGLRVEFEYEGDEIRTERRRGTSGRKGNGERYGLAVTQALLEEVAVRELDQPATGLRRLGNPRRPEVEVVFADLEQTLVVDPDRFLETRGGSRPRVRREGRAMGLTRIVGAASARDGTPAALEELRALGLESARRLGLAPDAHAVREVAETARRGRWVVDLGAAGFVELDTRLRRATASYPARPWSYGLVRIPEGFVRLEDGGMTVRLLSIRDSLTL